MYNPLSRVVRYFQREYPNTSKAATAAFFVAAALPAAIMLLSGGTLLPVLAAAGVAGLIGGTLALAMIGTSGFLGDGRPDKTSLTLNGVSLFGGRRDIASVYMTQNLINACTKKKEHQEELSWWAQRKIRAHISDIQGSLARLRVPDGEAATALSFTRKVLDRNGLAVDKVIATCELPRAADEARAALLPQVLASPGPLTLQAPAAPVPAISPEFGALAQKVEAVERRVGQLENPPLAILDKPKLG